MHLKHGTEKWRHAVVLVLVLAGMQQLAAAGLIQAKAWLAPILIERAWEQSRASGGAPAKPWPWADTWPVARLRVPRMNIDQLVLAGDSGNALAFGPGHSLLSAALGSAGLAVIGGHRDTHFAFLKQLAPGDNVHLDLADGQQRSYRIGNISIHDARRQSLPIGNFEETLLLVTCFPFDSLEANGPLRYVVSAVPFSGGGVLAQL